MSFEHKNPWITQSIQKFYENPWISVWESNVINPAGKKGIYGVVRFKNLAIGIVALDKDLNTYLVGQYRYAIDEYSWEIPEGGGPLAIPPLESARRELKEETGLTAQTWDFLGKIHTSNSVTNETGYMYLASDLIEGEPEFEDTEDITVKKLPLKEALDMIEKGEITDTISIAALLKVARKLGL